METILSGLNSLSAAQPVTLVKDGVGAHVQILHLDMEERIAGTQGEMQNTLIAMLMLAAQVNEHIKLQGFVLRKDYVGSGVTGVVIKNYLKKSEQIEKYIL